ncbi:MAG: MiaB/RimO family radical SAM methylthiotransferase [Actinomycetes bacterium]|jgi:threonylcarbamoyladenosine tRNA methylthiotransferase MtaB|nr:MiaB/RimO family radical SAM methylthiotransferase [Actinomycetes bacterium]
MMRYWIKTLGCKVNSVDSEALVAAIVADGGEPVADIADADVAIVNTCTVTAEADAKCRKEIRRAARCEHIRQVLVTGCAATLLKEQLEALDPKVLVVPMGEMSERIAANKKLPGFFSSSPLQLSTHTRAQVKVQDGCDNYCSYCIVPYARGHERSVDADAVIARVARLVDAGTREVVLTGVNVGSYDDPDLPTLIANLHERTGIHRIRLSSIEPQYVSDALIELIADGVLCEHLHIPLQSGSDPVLSAMRRRYSVAEYRDLIARIRERVPSCAITTDLIAGYPTETDDDFAASLDMLCAIGFAKTHVFRYSPRAGTRAAQTRPLPPRTVKSRAERAAAVAAACAENWRHSLTGHQLEFIVESVDSATGTAQGTSREYLQTSFPVPTGTQPGSLVIVADAR